MELKENDRVFSRHAFLTRFLLTLILSKLSLGTEHIIWLSLSVVNGLSYLLGVIVKIIEKGKEKNKE